MPQQGPEGLKWRGQGGIKDEAMGGLYRSNVGMPHKALEWLVGGFGFWIFLDFFWLDGAASQHETSRSNAHGGAFQWNGWTGEVVRLAFPRHRRGHLLHTVAGHGSE